ncbi:MULTISPECIES: hypothetical protein [unclassified Micromonospora]|uniref:hypothetical protein n=1 Tax=unclassified Micromonospora TaxID=2617518 RepID=UPI0033E5346B
MSLVDNAADRPPYSDCCPRCRFNRTPLPPLMVRENERGTGVVADYVCPRGHIWFTGWAWWSGERHDTDGLAA